MLHVSGDLSASRSAMAQHIRSARKEGDDADAFAQHEVEVHGAVSPGGKVHLVHSGDRITDDNGRSLEQRELGNVHGGFANRDDAKAAQLERLKDNWAKHGPEFDFHGSDMSDEDHERIEGAWNKLHPDRPVNPETGDNRDSEFENFATRMMGKSPGDKEDFPGVKAANEYFEDHSEPHNAVYLTSRKLS